MGRDEIDAEYQRRAKCYPGSKLGYSFMYTPETTLRTAPVMLVGLNPKADEGNASACSWDYSGPGRVNAYVEPWDEGRPLNPLQQQIVLLFAAIGVRKEQVFAANYIPFRSASWRDLVADEVTTAFADGLWRHVLRQSPARLICTLGKFTGKRIAKLLNAGPPCYQAANWGAQTIDVYRTDGGRVILSLPHLSRYKIFSGRPENGYFVHWMALEAGVFDG